MGQDKQLMGLKFFQQSIFALKISIYKNVKKQKIPIQYITINSSWCGRKEEKSRYEKEAELKAKIYGYGEYKWGSCFKGRWDKSVD